MQGFILKTTPYREEDLIVTVLTANEVVRLYRFYGARHSVIHLGYKIDFTIENTPNIPIGRLRQITHMGYPWNLDRDRMLVWQQFIALFEQHLRGIESLEAFYFELLDHTAQNLTVQDPKRACLNSYIELLHYEGRIHDIGHCFFCETAIHREIALARAFLPAHPECIYAEGFEANKIKELLLNKKSILMGEKEINYLWQLMKEGF